MGGFFDKVKDSVETGLDISTGGLYGAGKKLLEGPDAPPPPDIAARDAANLAAAQATARLNNPNIINQFGTQKYTQDASGAGTLTQTLSPEQQALYSSNTANQQSSSDIYGRGLSSMNNTLGQNLDLSGAPSNPNSYNPNQTPIGTGEQTRKRVIDAMMSRSNSRLGQANETQDANLIASGITPGTEAWRRAKVEQGQNFNDAASQAEIAGGNAATQQFGIDLQGRQQGAGEQAQQYGQQSELRKQNIAEAILKRQQPLNELNALRTGAQTSNPFGGQGYQGGGNIASTGGLLDQYNMDVYNQKVAGNNAIIGGVASIGGSAVKASDRRLKTKIKRIGMHKIGIGLYEWKYIDIPPKGLEDVISCGQYSVGVMADELKQVMPDAVININGYDFVNYQMIDN